MDNISMIVWNEFRNDARVLKEAETLQAAGYQVTVHALHTPGVTRQKEMLESGVNVVRVARSPLWKLRKRNNSVTISNKQNVSGPIEKISFRTQILRIIARLWTHIGLVYEMVKSKPDIVHSHDVNTLPTAWLVSVITRSPLVYDAHEISTDREGYSSFRKLVGWVEKHLMPRAAGTITTTDTRAKFFARAYRISRPLVLQNRPRFTQAYHSQRIREELNLTEAWPIIIYQGGVQQGRGLSILVEAMAKVKDAYCVFIGGGRLDASLKQSVNEMGLDKIIKFIPTVSLSELPVYTASADIGVQPIENTCLNHFSTDSNKLFEYTMAGLPVVASNLPEIRKLVEKFECGLLIPPGDTGALSSAIQQLVDDKGLRSRIAANSIAMSKSVNWEEQEDGLLSMYKNITSKFL